MNREYNEKWYELDSWSLDGKWNGCPYCDEDGIEPDEIVEFYIKDFEQKKLKHMIKDYIQWAIYRSASDSKYKTEDIGIGGESIFSIRRAKHLLKQIEPLFKKLR